MNETLHPILVLLDEGLSLYRRHFVPFLLIAAGWCVPFALLSALVVISSTWADSPALPLLAGLGTAVLLFPLTIYLLGGLSRAAVTAAEGQPVRFRAALALPPLRMLGVGVFTLCYGAICQVVAGVLSMALTCPAYLLALALGGVFSAVIGGDVGSLLVGFAILLMFGLIYLLSVALSGGSLSSIVYAIQPWMQSQDPFGKALQNSIDMLTYRFWHNLLTWCLAALILAGVGLSVIVTVGVLLPLPLTFVLGAESTLVRAISICAWALGAVVMLPPLPIWMALLYRRNQARYQGLELSGQVQAWALLQQVPPAEPMERPVPPALG